MPDSVSLQRAKFDDPEVCADGAPRASVALDRLSTLWFNTGTLCNLACTHCYIDSSPRNDRLAYITVADVVSYLDEIAASQLPTRQIGLTGGEPFMNPAIVAIIETCLERGLRVLVLTNAMRPMTRHRAALLRLKARHGAKLAIRVSLDHYDPVRHENERGPGSWNPALDGVLWLAAEGFDLSVAGRTCWGEDEARLRAGFARLFKDNGVGIDAGDPERLVLFPEMDPAAEVPEITTACWSILAKSPDEMMCASARMVVRRKGAPRPVVVACTLLPDPPDFELGDTLAEAARPVRLNHPHCAKFCVLGGGACSRG